MVVAAKRPGSRGAKRAPADPVPRDDSDGPAPAVTPALALFGVSKRYRRGREVRL